MRTRIALVSVCVALVFALGCDKKGEEGAEKGAEKASSLDAGQKFAFDGIKEDLAEIKKLVAEKKIDDTLFKCAAIEGYSKTLVGVEDAEVKKVLADSDKVCNWDIPLASAQENATKIEETLKKDPEAILVGPCMKLGTALDTLKKAKTKDEELLGKLAAVAKKHCE